MRKAYISLREWRDNTDGHLYREGEPFPFDGREIPKERLDSLESGHNRAGLRLIRAEEVQDEPEEARKEETPEKAPVARKTATKKRTTKK
jgi:hypothetical protein